METGPGLTHCQEYMTDRPAPRLSVFSRKNFIMSKTRSKSYHDHVTVRTRFPKVEGMAISVHIRGLSDLKSDRTREMTALKIVSALTGPVSYQVDSCGLLSFKECLIQIRKHRNKYEGDFAKGDWLRGADEEFFQCPTDGLEVSLENFQKFAWRATTLVPKISNQLRWLVKNVKGSVIQAGFAIRFRFLEPKYMTAMELMQRDARKAQDELFEKIAAGAVPPTPPAPTLPDPVDKTPEVSDAAKSTLRPRPLGQIIPRVLRFD